MTAKGFPKPNLKIEDLQPGDVLLFPPNTLADGGWVGQAIILLTGGQVSHSAVYRGEKDGELKVAHAAPPGVVSESFEALLKSEPGCFVKRRIVKTGLQPILTIADGYTDHGNPYPFLNLGVLGLLLLASRFSEQTARNRIFYDFALFVGLKIMKAVEKHKHPEKKPMTCSQFAAQCFTDAGEEYDIKFNKLLIQFGSVCLSNDEDSLNILSLIDMSYQNRDVLLDIDLDSVLMKEDKITSDFLQLLGNSESNTVDLVNKDKLGIAGKILMEALCEAMIGKKPSSVEEAVNLFSTNRNYYVSPDDLLSNTSNLEDVGYIDKSVIL